VTLPEPRHCPTDASGARDGEKPQEKPQAAVCTARIRARTPTHSGTTLPPGITLLSSSRECQQAPAVAVCRQSPPALTGRAAHPQAPTAAIGGLQPPPLPIALSLPGFPLCMAGRGCQAPRRAAQKQPLQERRWWKFQHRVLPARESLVYKNAFPFPHVFFLKANKCRQMSPQLQLRSGHQSTQISLSDAVPSQPKTSLEI